MREPTNHEEARYRLQRKEPYTMPNVLGNHSMPVKTYRWKDIAVSSDFEALKKYLPNSPDYRIIDTFNEGGFESKVFERR